MAPAIALTAGEPGGIGPDLCVMLAQEPPHEHIVVVADRELLAERARMIGLPWEALPENCAERKAGALPLLHVPLAARAVP